KLDRCRDGVRRHLHGRLIDHVLGRLRVAARFDVVDAPAGVGVGADLVDGALDHDVAGRVGEPEGDGLLDGDDLGRLVTRILAVEEHIPLRLGRLGGGKPRHRGAQGPQCLLHVATVYVPRLDANVGQAPGLGSYSADVRVEHAEVLQGV